MFVKVYNQKGEETGKTALPKELFEVSFNSDLVHQVVVSQMGNRRQVSAHTKGRGDVRGGGRKPWRQKGTGRARAGSRRSPIWRGGGITFGPTNERNFKKIIPQKMRRKALFMVLSQKAKDSEIIILDKLKLEKAKTKEAANIVRLIRANKSINQIRNSKAKSSKTKKQESFLIALPKMDENIIRAARNLPKATTILAKDLNCLDILSYKYLMLPKEAIKIIKDTFIK